MTTTSSAALALFQHIYGDGRGFIRVFSGERSTPAAELTAPHKAFYSAQHAAGNAEQWLMSEDAAGRDVFHAAHLFSANEIPAGKRLKDIAADVLTLYADIDEGHIPADHPPTALVESSPGRLQGYWLLNRAVAPAVAEALNRRIAELCGADPSGYDLTQNLRVPGTHNNKYADRPLVRLVYVHEGVTYDPDELDRTLPAAREQAAPRYEPSADDEDDPPFEGIDPALWQGKQPKHKSDGTIQRFTSLMKIGRGIYDAGGRRRGIVTWLRERDHTLGWHKFCERGDGDQQYHRIVDILEAKGRTARAIFEGRGDQAAADSPCAHWKAEAEHWKARAVQAEALVAEMQAEQSVSAQIKRNAALKAAAPANLAAINWLDSEVRRGQVDPSGFVRAPMKYIGEVAGSSPKRTSEHIADVGEKIGLFKRTHRWETCSPTTGEVYGQPIKVTYLKPLMPKIEAMRRLATYAPDEADGNGWGGKREKRLACETHPDSDLLEITGCATCGAVLKERTIAGCRTGQDDPSENDPAPPSCGSTFLGQDDPSEDAEASPARAGWYTRMRMKDPIDDFRDCAHCGKHQRYEVCLDCAKKLGDWGVHAAEVAS